MLLILQILFSDYLWGRDRNFDCKAETIMSLDTSSSSPGRIIIALLGDVMPPAIPGSWYLLSAGHVWSTPGRQLGGILTRGNWVPWMWRITLMSLLLCLAGIILWLLAQLSLYRLVQCPHHPFITLFFLLSLLHNICRYCNSFTWGPSLSFSVFQPLMNSNKTWPDDRYFVVETQGYHLH